MNVMRLMRLPICLIGWIKRDQSFRKHCISIIYQECTSLVAAIESCYIHVYVSDSEKYSMTYAESKGLKGEQKQSFFNSTKERRKRIGFRLCNSPNYRIMS